MDDGRPPADEPAAGGAAPQGSCGKGLGSEGLSVFVLGDLTMEAGGAAIEPPSGRRPRALLAWLALGPAAELLVATRDRVGFPRDADVWLGLDGLVALWGPRLAPVVA